jgi:hypothetical protein
VPGSCARVFTDVSSGRRQGTSTVARAERAGPRFWALGVSRASARRRPRKPDGLPGRSTTGTCAYDANTRHGVVCADLVASGRRACEQTMIPAGFHDLALRFGQCRGTFRTVRRRHKRCHQDFGDCVETRRSEQDVVRRTRRDWRYRLFPAGRHCKSRMGDEERRMEKAAELGRSVHGRSRSAPARDGKAATSQPSIRVWMWERRRMGWCTLSTMVRTRPVSVQTARENGG